MTTFEGFGPKVKRWFEGLEDDNSREYFAAHRDIFETAIRDQMQALLTELSQKLGGEVKLFRQNRDIRFSPDKSPYKTNTYGVIYGSELAPQGLYASISARGLVAGSGYHMMARDQLEVQVVTPVYFGSRHVNLKPDKTIRTPADLAGIKLRMPPGEFWQFLGESIGASPTPVAFAEVYTALQSGAIDGQDNPLVTSKLMKFYEVTTQFVLTGHVVGYDVMAVSKKAWDAMPPAQQTQFQAAAEKAMDDYTAKYIGLEKDIVEFMKSQGKKVYAPDVNAFRAYAQKKYVDKYAQDWPKGALERINAL